MFTNFLKHLENKGEFIMASGIKGSANRPKSGKNLKSRSNKKRHKVNTEAQAKYHTAIASRRSKKMKK